MGKDGAADPDGVVVELDGKGGGGSAPSTPGGSSRAGASKGGGIHSRNPSVEHLVDLNEPLESRVSEEPEEIDAPKPLLERFKERMVKDYYVPRDAIKGEIAAGLVVGLAVVPEAIAFAIVVGIKPQVGVDTTLIVAIVMGIFGDRPGLCNGASGAIAVVIKDIVEDYDESYMGYTVILGGIFCVLFGMLRLPKFMNLISSSVMVGFVNALAIIIASAQVKGFKKSALGTPESAPSPVAEGGARHLLGGSHEVFLDGGWVDTETGMWMLLEVAVCIAVMAVMPKIKNKWAHVIPSSIIGILASTFVEHVIVRNCGGRTATVGDIGKMSGDIPKSLWNRGYDVPPLNGDTLSKIWPTAATLAAVALTEQLMTLQVVNDLTRSESNAVRESVGLGIGNVVAGFFGGMGGNAMIAHSVIQVKTGGVRRLSNIMVGVTVFLITIIAYKLVNKIPIAGTTGMMWMISYYTFEWNSFRFIYHALTPLSTREKKRQVQKIKRTDVIVIIVVTIATLFSNLAVGVVAGMLINLIAYSWDSAKQVRLVGVSMDTATDPATGEERTVKSYEVEGPLFFASARQFKALFDKDHDPDDIEIHCGLLQVMDFSALEAFNSITSDYAGMGKRVHLRFLTEESHRFLAKGRGRLANLSSWQVMKELGEDEAAEGGLMESIKEEKHDLLQRRSSLDL